jgi:hypothetical protein
MLNSALFGCVFQRRYMQDPALMRQFGLTGDVSFPPKAQ